LLGELVFTPDPVGRKRIHGTNLSNPAQPGALHARRGAPGGEAPGDRGGGAPPEVPVAPEDRDAIG
jgi:hypothetical protein